MLAALINPSDINRIEGIFSRDMADLCPKQEAVWLKVDIDSPIEYAATIIVNLLTALLMIEDITTLNSGDSVVQNGATSIVCQCFVQLGHLRSICSINITRDRNKRIVVF
ncbi:unnamed protein product [Linum tenue]|uniref:Uncharacterized protein n=1 Tax=Linum tenue TaxID=586396 RepID=A0AAV0MV16_9ROSI|nr:unnamed protein product [Linum tenue]